jgi:phospholipase/lecithinase/hemolysin
MLDLYQANTCRVCGRLYFHSACGKIVFVQKAVQLMVGFLLLGSAVFPAQATFTNLYIFGDGICTTTNNPSAGQYYYGLRRSNGRVWVEVLAQEQGLTNNYWYSNSILNRVYYTNLSASSTNWSYSSNNWSYYGQYSSNLLNNLTNFTAPPAASNALFVVWVNDADFVGDMGDIYTYYGTNIAKWTNAVNQSLTNHWKIITNLYYAKGARTLIMPNAVDITKIPQFNNNPSADKAFIRQRIIAFNTNFNAVLSQARSFLTGITIYEPDFFALLDNILTNAAAYGLTNVLDGNGQSTDVIEDDSLTNKALNGPGANYVFWDATDPTAKTHALMANAAQQLISPVRISKITWLGGSNRLDVTNIPIGQNGLVIGRTNLVLGNWTTNANFNSTNATQTIYVPASGPRQFYRLGFPFTWSWP